MTKEKTECLITEKQNLSLTLKVHYVQLYCTTVVLTVQYLIGPGAMFSIE